MKLFVVIGGVFGLFFALYLPPLSGMDETAHYLRIATAANGHWVAPAADANPPDYVIDGCDRAFVNHSPMTAINIRGTNVTGSPRPWASRFENPPCVGSAPARDVEYGIIRRSEPYPVLAYAPAMVGYRVGRAFGGSVGGYYAARILQLAGYLALVGLALRIIPFGRGLLFVAGLLPIAIQAAATLSADVPAIGFGFLLGALCLQAAHGAAEQQPRPPSAWISIGTVALVLGLVKAPYVVACLWILVVPTSAFGSTRRRIAWSTGIISTCAIAVGIWATWGIPSYAFPPLPGTPYLDTAQAHTLIRSQPIEFLAFTAKQFTNVNQFQYLATRSAFPTVRYVPSVLPFNLYLLLCIGILALIVKISRLPLVPTRSFERTPARDWSSRRSRTIQAVVAVTMTVGSIVLTSYGFALGGLMTNDRIEGFQGRYLIPLAPLLLLVVDPTRMRRLSRRQVSWIPWFSTALLAFWVINVVWVFTTW